MSRWLLLGAKRPRANGRSRSLIRRYRRGLVWAAQVAPVGPDAATKARRRQPQLARPGRTSAFCESNGPDRDGAGHGYATIHRLSSAPASATRASASSRPALRGRARRRRRIAQATLAPLSGSPRTHSRKPACIGISGILHSSSAPSLRRELRSFRPARRVYPTARCAPGRLS